MKEKIGLYIGITIFLILISVINETLYKNHVIRFIDFVILYFLIENNYYIIKGKKDK